MVLPCEEEKSNNGNRGLVAKKRKKRVSGILSGQTVTALSCFTSANAGVQSDFQSNRVTLKSSLDPEPRVELSTFAVLAQRVTGWAFRRKANQRQHAQVLTYSAGSAHERNQLAGLNVAVDAAQQRALSLVWELDGETNLNTVEVQR